MSCINCVTEGIGSFSKRGGSNLKLHDLGLVLRVLAGQGASICCLEQGLSERRANNHALAYRVSCLPNATARLRSTSIKSETFELIIGLC